MESSKVKFDTIIHIKEIDDYYYVFYNDEDNFGIGLIRKDSNDWKWLGGMTRLMDDLEFSYFNPVQLHPIVYGVIDNGTVSSLRLEKGSNLKEACL